MNPTTVMSTPLRDLEIAITRGDVQAIGSAVARLVAPAAGLYALAPPTSDTERQGADLGRGDRVIQCQRCVRALNATGRLIGAAGVAFDPSWVIQFLEWVISLLTERKTSTLVV